MRWPLYFAKVYSKLNDGQTEYVAPDSLVIPIRTWKEDGKLYLWGLFSRIKWLQFGRHWVFYNK